MSEDLTKKSSNEHKYTNKNCLHRLFLNRFLDTIFYEISKLDPKTILDFGCGEGFFLKAMKDRGLSGEKILGVDNRKQAIEKASSLLPEYDFKQIDLFQINPDLFQFDLIMAIEVLEHLYEPEKFVKHLTLLSSRYVLFTVPFEPWFQIVNLLRGRNILRLGNHPEHFNHWSPASFRKFLTPYIKIKTLFVKFPWIVSVGTTIQNIS